MCRSRRRWPASPWASSTPRAPTPPSPTSSVPRTPSATWTSRSPAPPSSSPPCSSTPRSTACPPTCWPAPCSRPTRPARRSSRSCTTAIAEPRDEVGETAPKIVSFEIPIDKIGEVIGPKGKVINAITTETGADVSVDDDGMVGRVSIGSSDKGAVEEAKRQIQLILNPPTAEVGQVYPGRVVNITKFGAFVNILPGRDGLLHISKIGGGKRIDRVEDVLDLGDQVEVRVDDVDPGGKVSLSLASSPPPAEGDGGGRGDRGRDRSDRGDRGDRATAVTAVTAARRPRAPSRSASRTASTPSCVATWATSGRPPPARARAAGAVATVVATAAAGSAADPPAHVARRTDRRHPRDTPGQRRAHRHRAHARGPVGVARRLGRRSAGATSPRARRAHRTSSSTCCSRARRPARRGRSPRRSTRWAAR